jgi:hypothetical protein
MEDISRELEKEISKAKPKVLKRNRTIKVLIVDDTGNIRYGNRYKTLIILLSILSIISICTSIMFFQLYSSISGEALSNKANLASAQKKIESLTVEREQLIAQLVLLGEEPEILKNKEQPGKSKTEHQNNKVSGTLNENSPSSKLISEPITEEKIK